MTPNASRPDAPATMLKKTQMIVGMTRAHNQCAAPTSANGRACRPLRGPTARGGRRVGARRSRTPRRHRDRHARSPALLDRPPSPPRHADPFAVAADALQGLHPTLRVNVADSVPHGPALPRTRWSGSKSAETEERRTGQETTSSTARSGQNPDVVDAAPGHLERTLDTPEACHRRRAGA